MAHSGVLTIDHDEIRDWVEERDGHPAVVRSTKDDEGEGLLRIDFGEREEKLEEISWEQFFKIFEDNNLAFLYQNETADGETSFFNKFVDRDAHRDELENGGADDETDEDDEDEPVDVDEEGLD